MMCEEEIKQEFMPDLLPCRTCLSIGRKLLPLGSHVDLLRKIMPQCEYWNICNIEMVQICWECQALLSKMVEFQQRVIRATEMLQMRQAYIYGTLSNLTTVTFNDASPNTIYIAEPNASTHAEPNPKMKDFNYKDIDTGHLSDDIDNSVEESVNIISYKTEVKKEADQPKIKRKPKWPAKKPKFKVLEDSKEVFRKVKINNEELLVCLKKEIDGEPYKLSTYKCERCVRGFKGEKSLAAHLKGRHSKKIGPYTCDICDTHTYKKSLLKQHVAAHYYKYECVLCGFSCYHKAHTHVHRDKHRKVFQCLKCDMILGNKEDCKPHLIAFHSKFVCDICSVTRHSKKLIERHIKYGHSPRKPCKCDQCGKKFASKLSLKTHQKQAHSAPSAADERRYCVQCDLTLSSEYIYQAHLRYSKAHSNDNHRYPCSVCGKDFSHKRDLKFHFDRIHSGKTDFHCKTCGKYYSRKGGLEYHIKRVHLKIQRTKDKLCTICGRGFYDNRILKNHIRTHTGERPFACALCPAAFAQPWPLKKHTATQHPQRTQVD